jgi:hypothetical protein
MKPILKAKVPPTNEIGSCFLYGTSSIYETFKENILWQYNKLRERDGHEPVKRMPVGTEYLPMAGFGS